MNIKQREKIVNQLITCQFKFELGGVTYLIKDATADLRSEAQTIYDETLERHRFESWLREVKVPIVLMKRGLWTFEGDKNLKELERRIEDLKVELFNAGTLREKLSNEIRQQLSKAKEKLQNKLNLRHSLDHLTVEGYAEFVKQQFLVVSCLYHADTNTKVFKEVETADQQLLDCAMGQIYSRKPSNAELREIARTDPWRTYWNISRNNPFSISLIDLSDEQRTVLLYSKMYDSCYDHPECPSEEIMEDDDMLDGWLIMNRRKREQDKQTDAINEHIDKKHGNAREVFVVAESEKGVEKINQLNSVEAVIAKKRKAKMLQAKGQVDDKDMPDQIEERGMQATRQAADKMRGS